MKILTAEQMNEVDRLSSRQCGVASLVLMENAGVQLYLKLLEYFEDLDLMRIAIICGPGNNGGDGFVLARQLLQRNHTLEVYLLASPDRLRGDAKTNYDVLGQHGLKIHSVPDLNAWAKFAERLRGCDILVDALLGTGINRPLDPRSLFGAAAADINGSEAFVLSVDMPSGMPTDSLEEVELSVVADATVTFTAPKIAQILNADIERLGDLHVVPIGSPPALVDDNPQHWLNLIDAGTAASAVSPRLAASHKGDYGRVAIVAGSRGKSGAAVLAARAALRAGAGLVTAVLPEAVQLTAAAGLAEMMTEGLADTDRGTFKAESADEALELLKSNDCGVLGPGIGGGKDEAAFARRVVESSPVPLVLDADGLNAFAQDRDRLRSKPSRPLVLTPHPGEFSRLTGVPVDKVESDRIRLAREYALDRQVWLVLKGFRTLAATPEGQVYACPLGNPGMATAGMGDVLSGVLGAVLAACDGSSQAVDRAVCLGVYVHSLAGDLAEEELGSEALNAGDVIERLGQAFQQLTGL